MSEEIGIAIGLLLILVVSGVIYLMLSKRHNNLNDDWDDDFVDLDL